MNKFIELPCTICGKPKLVNRYNLASRPGLAIRHKECHLASMKRDRFLKKARSEGAF